MRHTRKHRKSYRGGSSDVEGSFDNVSNDLDNLDTSMSENETVDLLQSGGRRRSRRRSVGGRRSMKSRKFRTRKQGGRRSSRGGFMTGVGALLKDAMVPLALYGATRMRKSRSNSKSRSKSYSKSRSRSSRGGDIA